MPEMFVLPFRPAYDSNGRTVPGAQAWFTLTGTNTETPVYSDAGLTVEHSNPLEADGLGKFPRAYLDPAVTYRCRVYYADSVVGVDNPITDHDYDPYTGAEQGSQGLEGDPGENATIITVGTVTTGAAGTDAIVDETSLGGGVYQLDFTIPRGAPGVGGVSDGDYGDVIVSAGGTAMDIQDEVLFPGNFAPIAAHTLIGNHTAGAAVPGVITIGTAVGGEILDRDGGDSRYIQKTASRVFSVFIPAYAMLARASNGAGTSTVEESSTYKVNYDYLHFDPDAAEYAQFFYALPKSWNEGTVTMQAIWTSGGGTPGQVVRWLFAVGSVGDGDSGDIPFGTAVEVSDTLSAAGSVHLSSFSSAITAGGSAAEGDLVVFQVGRNATDGSDTLTVDAKLIGVRLNFTVNAQDDS